MNDIINFDKGRGWASDKKEKADKKSAFLFNV